MIKLKDAKITDGVPHVLAEQPWVQALAMVQLRLQDELLEKLEAGTSMYDVEHCDERMLDNQATFLKIEWYDSSADIETKRRIVKSAVEIRRYAGTAKAVREQVSAIYPNSEVKEWFEYGGTPGRWQLRVNITNAKTQYHTIDEMERLLGYTKRLTAHLERISYLVMPDESVAYVGTGYHGTAQRVSARITGTLRPKDHKATTYAPAGCAAYRMQMAAHIKGDIRPVDHTATALAPVGVAAYRQQFEIKIGGINT